MAISSLYVKKNYISQKSFLNHAHYTDKSRKIIEDKKDSDLLGIRCTDGIIRTFQGIYLLENLKAENGEKKRVKNADFVNYMRNHENTLPKNRRILTTRVCELEDKSRIVFYTAGTYNTREADFQSPRLNVLNSKDNIAYFKYLPSRISLAQKDTTILLESDDHARCDRLFFVGNNNIAQIMCEEKLDHESIFTTFALNLNTGKIKQIEKCKNNYKYKLITFCE